MQVILRPDIFTDSDSNFDTLPLDGLEAITRLKVAALIKDIIGR